MLVLHFGMLHDAECTELSTTTDWVRFEEVAEESLANLNLEKCPQCLQ